MPQPDHRTRESFLVWEATQADRWELIAGRESMKVSGTVAHNNCQVCRAAIEERKTHLRASLVQHNGSNLRSAGRVD